MNASENINFIIKKKLNAIKSDYGIIPYLNMHINFCI